MISGEFGHNHEIIPLHGDEIEIVHNHDHNHAHEADINAVDDSTHSSDWNWISTSFLIVSLIALFIISTVNDHFLEDHLWGHIIKKHFSKIFLWTFGTLLFIHLLGNYLDINYWIENNMISILVIAVLIGIIPESGPHYIFILLFAQGTIPISILIANSIVQDGHGALPLLAESKRSFILVKLANVIVGFIIGYLGMQIGF